MAELSPEALLRASSLSELGEIARELGLGSALRAPMVRVLGPSPKPGRMTREVAKLAAALGTDDVGALLVDAEPLLAPRPMQGVKKKLFEHARTYLFEAASDESEGIAPPPLTTSEAGDEGPRRPLARAPAAASSVARSAGSAGAGSAGAGSAGAGSVEPSAASAVGRSTASPGAQGAPSVRGSGLGAVGRTGTAADLLVGRRAVADEAPPTKDRPPRTRAALQAWARDAEVSSLLSQRLFRTLSERLPRLFTNMVDPQMENAPIEDVLTDPNLGAGSRRARQRLAELQAAAWAYLYEAAEEARRGIEEEAAAAWDDRRRPDDPARRSLIAALLAHREAVREVAAPRPRSRLQPSELSVEPGETPVAEYREESESRLAFPIRVTIVVERDQTLTVRSTHSGSDADPYVISAVDEVLTRLFDPEDATLAPLVEAFHHPPWLRGLVALDAATRPEADASLAGPLGWWLGLEPTLDLRPVVRKARGTRLGRPKPIALEAVLACAEVLAPVDREVAELLDLAEVASRRSAEDALRLRVRALERLADHPRLFLGDDAEPGTVTRGRLGLLIEDAPDGLQVVPDLSGQALDGASLSAARLGRGAGGMIFVRPDEHSVVFDVVTAIYDRALAVLARYPTAIPTEEREALIGRLNHLERIGPVRFAASVPRVKTPAQPTLVLRLQGREDGVVGRVRVRLLAGSPLYVPGEGPLEAVAARPDRSLIFTPRDLDAELAWATALAEEVLEGAAPAFQFALTTPEAVFSLLARLRSRTDVIVEWSEAPWKVAQALLEDLRVEVKDRTDWFGLSGGLDVDGQRVALAVLLAAGRAGKKFVTLAPGEFVVLEQALVDRLCALEPAVHERRGGLAVSSAGAAAVEALGADAGGFEVSERWSTAVARMEAALSLEPQVPEGLQAELRPYQQAGFQWLARLSTWGLGACLADDMGLGKTLQTLTVLLARSSEGPALVVAPTSVTFNWAREAERFTPSLRVVRYGGPDRTDILKGLGPGDVVVTSYGLVVRDEGAICEVDWGSLVLDEAQAVKNAQSQRSKVIRRVPARWRLALSGTPVENRLSELWSLFRAVEPGLFGSWEQFKTRFAQPIERDGDAATAEALARLIRPFVLRRTKREVAPELPPRTDIVVDVVLSDPERALYEDVRLATLAQLEEGSTEDAVEGGRFQVLAALTRLRQLACHPKLDDPESEVPSAKLQRLLRLVEDLLEEGQQALIFSQFTGHLAQIRAAFEARAFDYLYLDGQTPVPERARLVDAFQAGEAPLFLISLKAGGTGLNLTAADNVILLDPWWNPAVEDQATDRAHRIGREQPVTVYRLVARDTVEDAILALHAKKRALVGKVLEGSGAAASLGVDELVHLIRGG